MSRFERDDWYQEAVAYDIVFDAGTRDEADFIEGAFERHARGEPGRVASGARRRRRSALEPACGTGRLVVELARRGWGVTGYDLADGSIRHARRRIREEGLDATVAVGAMQDWVRKRRFDLAFNFVSTFKYLMSDADAIAHLRNTAGMLRPGGLYLLGLHVTDYRDQAAQSERWVERRGSLEVTAVIRSEPPNRRRRTEQMRARISCLDHETGARRRFETRWTFRTYGPRQLKALLDAVPELELVAVHDFSYRLDEPGRFGGDQLDHLLVLRRIGAAD